MTRPRETGAPGLTYKAAGVDAAAGEEAVRRIRPHVQKTYRREVVGDIGGFGGLFAFDTSRYRNPLLVSSTDGVGTKAALAADTGKYSTIGIDLVAMSADDIAVQGAEPLVFLDYISVGDLQPDMVEEIVAGVAQGCVDAGCALIGGEMSEHPGEMPHGRFDLVGFAVGVVERDEVLPQKVSAGDAVVGIASPGVRCNGYALARRAFELANRSWDDPAWAGADRSLADELLLPSVIYAKSLLAIRRLAEVHAFAHITSTGIVGNLRRVMPSTCDAVIRRGSWRQPRIFDEIQRVGNVPQSEMDHVFNLGLGMLAVVPQAEAASVIASANAEMHDAWLVGEIVAGSGDVVLTD